MSLPSAVLDRLAFALQHPCIPPQPESLTHRTLITGTRGDVKADPTSMYTSVCVHVDS